MCIIIYSPAGTIPRKHLQRGLTKNPDGWGFMVSTKEGKVHIAKGMDRNGFWASWRQRPIGPVVFHARKASHGEKSETNCHPFMVPGHGELAMAHNGIIRAVKEDKVLSDTVIFNESYLRGLPKNFLENDAICRLIEHFIDWSKIVFLKGNGECYILNEHKGDWSNGRWYSNDGWKKPKPKEMAAKWSKNGQFWYIHSGTNKPTAGIPNDESYCNPTADEGDDRVEAPPLRCGNSNDKARAYDERGIPTWYARMAKKVEERLGGGIN